MSLILLGIGALATAYKTHHTSENSNNVSIEDSIKVGEFVTSRETGLFGTVENILGGKYGVKLQTKISETPVESKYVYNGMTQYFDKKDLFK